MEKEFKEIIEKNLPAQVGDVLQKRLAKAVEDEQTVKSLNTTLSFRNEEITKLSNRIEEYKKFDERNTQLTAREIAVGVAERNLQVERLKDQLAAEKDKTQFVREVTLGLVRNTEYRKSVFNNENKNVPDQYGSTRYINESSNSDQTESAQ
jgi:hypothetical protein